MSEVYRLCIKKKQITVLTDTAGLSPAFQTKTKNTGAMNSSSFWFFLL